MHYTGWEDEQLASVRCDGTDTGLVLSLGDDQPCPLCGILLRLIWHVEIEEGGLRR